VFERLSGAGLPEGVETEIEPPFSASGLVYRYTVQSPDRTASELHVLQDWVLDKALSCRSRVADVASLGGETMQYQVLIDPTKLAGTGLALATCPAALTSNNSNGGGGFISEGGQFFYVRGIGRVVTLEDIGNVVVAVKNGVPVLIKDIGTVEIGTRAAARPVRIQQTRRRRRRRHPDAHRASRPKSSSSASKRRRAS
jgi:cobalt-zinc-cadmium resistance protein CzcA